MPELLGMGRSNRRTMRGDFPSRRRSPASRIDWGLLGSWILMFTCSAAMLVTFVLFIETLISKLRHV